jgi:3-oxoacyl-[acyl-carrier-protein] synthase II
MRKVVITGIGVVSPLGSNVPKFWAAAKNGESGIVALTRIDSSRYATKIAGEVRDFNAEAFIPKKEVRRLDLFVQYAIGAAAEACADSGIDFEKIDSETVGCVIGSGVGGLRTLEEQYGALVVKGPDRVSPFFIPMMIADMAAGMVAIRFHAKGPNYATVSACASGAHALAESLRHIQMGDCEVMIAGGSEAAITDCGMAGFCNMKAMSTRNDNPAKASSPFDIKRDGFVMGEGAGIIVLESEEHAKRRGAKIYAEFAGAGLSCDAHHITAPMETGEGAANAMKRALKSAGLNPTDVDYINAHGTSTPLNDQQETRGMKTVFGEHAYKLNVSSTKSMIGHLLGASGAVEFITSALTIKEGIITPTINYEDPDPEMDLNYTPNTAVERDVKIALSNSFGFGGHNASLVLRKYAG